MGPDFDVNICFMLMHQQLCKLWCAHLSRIIMKRPDNKKFNLDCSNHQKCNMATVKNFRGQHAAHFGTIYKPAADHEKI